MNGPQQVVQNESQRHDDAAIETLSNVIHLPLLPRAIIAFFFVNMQVVIML